MKSLSVFTCLLVGSMALPAVPAFAEAANGNPAFTYVADYYRARSAKGFPPHFKGSVAEDLSSQCSQFKRDDVKGITIVGEQPVSTGSMGLQRDAGDVKLQQGRLCAERLEKSYGPATKYIDGYVGSYESAAAAAFVIVPQLSKEEYSRLLFILASPLQKDWEKRYAEGNYFHLFYWMVSVGGRFYWESETNFVSLILTSLVAYDDPKVPITPEVRQLVKALFINDPATFRSVLASVPNVRPSIVTWCVAAGLLKDGP